MKGQIWKKTTCILVNPLNFQEIKEIAIRNGLNVDNLKQGEEPYYYLPTTGSILNWRSSLNENLVIVIDINEFRIIYKPLPNCTCYKNVGKVFCDNSCKPNASAEQKGQDEIGFECEICSAVQSLGAFPFRIPNPAYCDKCKSVIKHIVLDFRKDKVV